MKVGENIPVTIAGQVVANATITELSDGTATLVVPATRVVMATQTSLAVEEPSQESETVILGVEQRDAEPQREAEQAAEEQPNATVQPDTNEPVEEVAVEAQNAAVVSEQVETSE